MNYKNIECGNINGRKDSDYLPGALSPNQDFFYLEPSEDKELIASSRSVACFVPENIKDDYHYEIFVDENGAIADAYNFKKLSSTEIENEIKKIITEKKLLYPEYEFKILEGRFPLNVDWGEKEMSSHILYITNYKEHLKTPNNKSL